MNQSTTPISRTAARLSVCAATHAVMPLGPTCHRQKGFSFWRETSMAEPPELSRLKCAGHHPKGNTVSNVLQMEQFLVCRVTSRYNHRFSDHKHTPHDGESRDITTIHILQHMHSIYYKLIQSIITDPKSVNVIQAISLKFRV